LSAAASDFDNVLVLVACGSLNLPQLSQPSSTLFLNPFINLDEKKQSNPYPIQKKLFCFHGAEITESIFQ